MLSRETLTNPERVAAAVDVISPFLIVDADLDAGTVGTPGTLPRSLSERRESKRPSITTVDT